MKVIKVIATYLNDFADKLSNGDINLSKAQLKDLMETLIEMDSDTKEESKEECKEESKDDEECLACELMNILGLEDNFFDDITPEKQSKLGGTKVTVRVIPKKEGINKMLKQFKNGGSFTMESIKKSELSEIFSEDKLSNILSIFNVEDFVNGQF